MRMNCTNKIALGLAVLACTLPAGLSAQTLRAANEAPAAAASASDQGSATQANEASPTPSAADDQATLAKKLAAMEARIEQLESELKAKQTATSTSASIAEPQAGAPDAQTPAPAPAPAAAATEAPAAPPNPLAGITGVLGGVNLTGLVDVYYGYNSDNPKIGTYNEPFTPYNKQFALNLLELQLDKPVDKSTPLGFRMTFGYGEAMNSINGTDDLNLKACNNISGPCEPATNGSEEFAKYLKEGYLSYDAPVGKGLEIDAGKFVTPAGFEVIETNQNWNYSRGLLFYDAIPFWHMGARAKYTFNDKWSVMGIAANGWNNILATNSGKTGGVSLTYNPTKKIAITETYLFGTRDLFGDGNNSSWNHLTDTVVTYNPTSKLSLAAEFDYDHQGISARDEQFLETVLPSGFDYTGAGIFAKYAFNSKWAVAARGEYLNDHDGLATYQGTGYTFKQHPFEITGTIERTLANHLIARAEYRYDQSNKNVFEYGSVSARDTQNTADIGLVYVLAP